MAASIRIQRSTDTPQSGREYRADLIVNGVLVGRVEREQDGRGGGFDAGDYKATAEGITVAAGRTLADVRDELREWAEEEEKMGRDALWMRLGRDRAEWCR